MTAYFAAIEQEVTKLCHAVWSGYEENWMGRYMDRKVEGHKNVCHMALLNYCDINGIDFNDHFNEDFLSIDEGFDKFKDSTRILFDDIDHIKGDMNRKVYILGITYWLIEHTEDFFYENDIKDFNGVIE